MIAIEQLSQEEALTLFCKILYNKEFSFLSNKEKKEVKVFLEKIPSFPLDISTAAYYIKNVSLTFEEYMERITRNSQDFDKGQQTFLKETSRYTQTRYNLIALSITKLIEINPEYRDLLALAYLLDSQNIPLDILVFYKNSTLVDRFIYDLKKYSLITSHPKIQNKKIIRTFSLHRSIQSIGLLYLIKILQLEKNLELITNIANKLADYMNEIVEQEEVDKMEEILISCKTFLEHKELLTPEVTGKISGNLGIFYYYLGNALQAKNLLETSLSQLKILPTTNSIHIGFFLGYLGNAARDLGDYQKGRLLLRESLSIYKQHYVAHPFRYACFLIYLGIIERYLGNYDPAKDLFKSSITIAKQYFPENSLFLAWASGQLGIIEREVGNYGEAKEKLENSLSVFKTNNPSENFDIDIIWALEHLSAVYIKLGDYKKAKDTLEYCLRMYATDLHDPIGSAWILSHLHDNEEKEYPEKIKNLFSNLLEKYKSSLHSNYIYIAYPLKQLGKVYGELREYKKAKIILEQSLLIYQKSYGDDHLEVGRAFNELGSIYLKEKDFENSEKFFQKALSILENNKHPEKYECLESLSEIYIQRSILAANKEEYQNSCDLKKQAISYLRQALEVIKAYFPADSSHKKRIQNKLERLYQISTSNIEPTYVNLKCHRYTALITLLKSNHLQITEDDCFANSYKL